MGEDCLSCTTTILGAGIKLETEIAVTENIILKPTSIQIDHIDLMDRTLSRRDYGFICSIAEHISFGLTVTADTQKQAAIKGWNAQWVLVLLAVVLRKPIYHPISTFRNDGKEYYRLSNMFFSHKIFDRPHLITKREQETFLTALPNFLNINDNRFNHASSIAAHVHMEPKFSIRIAAIWSGIEALLGVDHELSFRIALACSKLLESDKEKRLAFFKHTKKLYNVRSSCVHGSFTETKKINEKEAECDSMQLLCRLILFFCNRGSLLSSEEMTEILIS